MAATAVEKEEWLKYMKCLCDDLRENRKLCIPIDKSCLDMYRFCLGGTPNSQHTSESPIWVPDYYTSVCMRCGKRFSMLNRRHHCRRCGFVVCNNCSTQRTLLPDQASQPLRVCDTCFQQLGNTPVARQDTSMFLHPDF